MYKKIGDKVSVAGVYKNAKFLPKKFLWKNREYHIKEVTTFADILGSGALRRAYSCVATNDTLYRLLFDRKTESWTLEELWCE